MTLVKRFSAFLAAAVLGLTFVVGSLSFMPKAFAVSDFEFPFSESDIPQPIYPYYIYFVSYTDSQYYRFNLIQSQSEFSCIFTSSGWFRCSPIGSSATLFYTYFDQNGNFYSGSSFNISSGWSTVLRFGSSSGFGNPLPYSNNVSIASGGVSSGGFAYSFSKPSVSKPVFWDYSPFYFPEMPHGYFDGNINVVDGTYNIDFPSNSSITGTIDTATGSSTDQYTWTLDGDVYWHGEDVQGQLEGWIDNGSMYGDPSGTITQTRVADRLVTLSLSNFDSTVLYQPLYNENSRFRCWSCVMDSSYVWFISDTRNKITGSIVSVTSDEVTWKYEFSDPQGGNTIYPTWAIVFSPMGEVIQVLSPTNSANKNVYTLSCSIGTLEQDSDTGVWSCDPLYHGLWFSQDSPPVQNISYLNVGENNKYLANPVFGEESFTLNFLSAINDNISGLRSDLVSLQSAITGSISNQTSTFQNMDAPSNFDPTDVNNMLEYGSLESDFQAPSTDDIFTVDSGTFTDGMGFWRDRMNELLFFSGSPALPMTIFSLTLGLAVLIIGRRVSGGGAA